MTLNDGESREFVSGNAIGASDQGSRPRLPFLSPSKVISGTEGTSSAGAIFRAAVSSIVTIRCHPNNVSDAGPIVGQHAQINAMLGYDLVIAVRAQHLCSRA